MIFQHKIDILTYNNNKKFTIQYIKEELDKFTLDFVTQMSVYISRVNDRIIKTFEEIEKEEEATTAVGNNDVEVSSAYFRKGGGIYNYGL